MWLSLSLSSFFHLVTVVLVTLHCLHRRRDSASALLWIFMAWSVPVLGPILYLSFGINRVQDKGWKKQASDQLFLSERQAREEGEMPLAYWSSVRRALAARPEDPFVRDLNSAIDPVFPEHPLLCGNSIRLLVSGSEAFPRMLDAIRSAQHHIHLQTFILSPDETGRRFMEALKERAEAGVEVRLMYDRFGSTAAWLSGLVRRYTGIPHFQLAGWTQANPIKRQFLFNLRNHRKILVVDGKTAFTGGLNLQDQTGKGENGAEMRDYHFEVVGPIVQELQYTFLRDWYFMTDENPARLLSENHFPRISSAGDALIRLVNAGPTSQIEGLTDVLFTAIVSARKQVLAVTPYFVPTRDLVRALRSAALRGVDVRLVLPGKSNHIYAGFAGRALYEDLLTAGVRVFEHRPPFVHAKALIVDDTVAVIGTANLDIRSLRLNYETNLIAYDDGFVNGLKRIVLEDIAMSDEISLLTWRRRPVYQHLIENACSLLTPIL